MAQSAPYVGSCGTRGFPEAKAPGQLQSRSGYGLGQACFGSVVHLLGEKGDRDRGRGVTRMIKYRLSE
jgi:hypothetical protein